MPDGPNYLANRLDETNLVLAEAWNRVKVEVDPIVDAHFMAGRTIADLIQQVSGINARELTTVCHRYSENVLQAIIAVAIYDNKPTFSPFGPHPEEENS